MCGDPHRMKRGQEAFLSFRHQDRKARGMSGQRDSAGDVTVLVWLVRLNDSRIGQLGSYL
jgi:hypothetical protein